MSESRWVSEAEFDALDDAVFGPVGGQGGGRGPTGASESDLDAIDDATFGPVQQVEEAGGASGRLSVEEAEWMVLDSAHAGHGYTPQQLAEARSVLERGVGAETDASRPGTERVAEVSTPAMNDPVLSRVVSERGGRTPGFTEAQDRQIDNAYAGLCVFAESRLGMPRQEAEDHARRVFLECRQISEAAKERTADFVARLEQRVAGYQAMPPLTLESKRAGGR